MTVLIEPSNGELPTHYILNNKCETAFNTSYNDLEAYHEAIIVDSIIYGKEDLGPYTLVNELDVVTGAESRANNKDKIIYGSNFSGK